METVIAPAGAEAAASLLADTRENAERVSKYLLRYKEVQQRRSSMQVRPTPSHCRSAFRLFRCVFRLPRLESHARAC